MPATPANERPHPPHLGSGSPGAVTPGSAAASGAFDAIPVRLDAPELDAMLRDGTHRVGGDVWHVRPREVRGDGADARVVFERIAPRTTGSRLGVWIRAVRPVSLTATATPCLATLLYGLAVGWESNGLVAATAALGALVLQLAVNLWNDAEDHTRLIDLPGTLGGAGVIQEGLVSARTVARVAKACLVLGLLAGVPALLRAPGPLLAIGLVALVGTAGYSGRPFGLKYRALGDLAVLVMCGPALTLGFAFAAFGRADATVLALGATFGAAAVGILHANNWQDADVDRARGASTVAGLLGPSRSKAYLVAVYAAAFAAWAVGWALAARGAGLHVVALALPALALVPVGRVVAKVLGARDANAPGLALVRVEAAQAHLALGLALAAGLGGALALR